MPIDAKPQQKDHELSDRVISHRRFIWILVIGFFLLSATLALFLVLKNFGQTYQQINLTHAVQQNSISSCWIIKLHQLDQEPLSELFDAPNDESTFLLYQSADPYLHITKKDSDASQEIAVFLRKKNSYFQSSWIGYLKDIRPGTTPKIENAEFGYLALQRNEESAVGYQALILNQPDDEDQLRSILEDPEVVSLYYGELDFDHPELEKINRGARSPVLGLVVIKKNEFSIYLSENLDDEPIVIDRTESDDLFFDLLKQRLSQDLVTFLQ